MRQIDWRRELGGWVEWKLVLSKQFIVFLSAWPIMLMGLELLSSHLSPIYPHPAIAQQNFSNLLNPWAGGCPNLTASTTDFSHDLCFGTNIARIGGPYSLMYYWTMLSLAGFGRFYPAWNNLDPFFLINLFLVWGIRRSFPGYGWRAAINPLYGWIALLFMIAFPQILLTLFLTAGSLLASSRYLKISLLTLAPLFRFPIGAPLYVWKFIFSFSIHVVGNAMPYGMTAVFWLTAIAIQLPRIPRLSFYERHHDGIVKTLIVCGFCFFIVGLLGIMVLSQVFPHFYWW